MADAALAPLFDWRSAIADSDLPPTQRHVALTLSLHMNARGGSAFPAVATLARETGLSKRAVQYALKGLHDGGWLENRRGQGTNGTNLYLAALPAHAQRGRPLSNVSEREGLTPSGATDDPPGAAAAPRSRAWTPVYDALLATIYGRRTADGMTREEKRQVALVARELHQAGATPADVAERVRRYRSHPTYAGVALTPMSLRRHWSEVAPPDPAGRTPPCPECGVGGGHHAEGCPRTHRPAG